MPISDRQAYQDMLRRFGGLGAATSNPLMERQVSRARGAFERPQAAQGARGALDFAAGVTMPIPIIGDVLGFSSDVARMRAEPEEQTALNMGLAALGLIPFVPPAVSYGLGRFAKARGVEIAPPPLGPAASQAGAIVYHGSPHKFDRFDPAKIGTGEGAQAYGHGLYLADNKDVAATYRNPGGPRSGTTPIDIDGVPASRWMQRAGLSPVEKRAADAIARTRNPEFAIDYLKQDAGYSKTAAEAMDWIAQNKQRFSDPGNLYSVDLPDPMISRMLDWDKPLSQQTPDVRKALLADIDSAIEKTKQSLSSASERRAPSTRADLEKLNRERARLLNLTGADFYRQQSLRMTSGGKNAFEQLRELGIPGIRYLDQGSRGAGQGTSNFVIFPGEEQNLQIMERNNEPLRSRE